MSDAYALELREAIRELQAACESLRVTMARGFALLAAATYCGSEADRRVALAFGETSQDRLEARAKEWEAELLDTEQKVPL